MTTPEMPPQSSMPDLPEPVVSSESNAAQRAPEGMHGSASFSAPETTTGPATSAPVDTSTESSSDARDGDAGPNGHATEGDHEEVASADGSSGERRVEGGVEGGHEKKRRRRRRKKKGGLHQPGDAAAAGDQGASTNEAGESSGPAAEGTEAGAAADTHHGAERHDRKDRRKETKEKKHAPRERPPVNISDIVFGKIVEVTDEALLIDIPGKAKAIFDRREMLLPEDDEEAARPTAPAGGPVDAQAAPADDHGPLAPEMQASPPAAEPAANSESLSVPADASTATSSDLAVDPAVEGEASLAPTPKDPKVPRVILEVGADFIGVVHNDGARGGLVVLTHHPRRAEKAKHAVEKAYNDKALVDGLVTGVIKGGLEVDIDGLRAFAPGSHVDLRLGADLSYLLARRLPFVVTTYAKRGRDVVLSRRSMLEEEARKTRAEALSRLKVGEELDGVVRSVVSFGAFIDVGGIEGLVPLQEMSHNRSDGPSDVFVAGEPTRVKVIKIDDKGKVWLSRKAAIVNPWQAVAQKYAMGTRHQGKAVRIQPFGAFVELEPGIDGLIHLADLSIKRIESPDEVVKVGDAIEVVVAHLDTADHKIGLHPAPQGDAATETPQRIGPHKAVKAKVVTIESGGLVVRILGVTGRNARGYITAAGTGTPRGTELRKAFNVGQELEAKVVEIDPRRGEVKLSIKALSEEQERSAYQQYRQQLKAEARFTFGDLLAKTKKP